MKKQHTRKTLVLTTRLRQTFTHIEMQKQNPSRRNCEVSRRVNKMVN